MSDELNMPPALAPPGGGSKTAPGHRGRKPGRAARIAAWGCWVYLILLVALWVLLYFAADRWWPGTFVLFGPRWLCFLPALALIPAAAWFRPRILLGPIPLSLFIALIPITDFCVPWRPLVTRSRSRLPIRVLTCNLHEAKDKDTEALGRLIQDTNPAIVAIQNWHERYQKRIFGEEHWHFRRLDQLYLASRNPIGAVALWQDPSITKAAAVARFEVHTPTCALQLINLHLTTPREGLAAILSGDRSGPEKVEANIKVRRRESAAVRALVDQVAGPVLVVGDFNVPVESCIYRQFWNDYTDAFGTAGLGWGHTFHTRRSGVRIDHILGGPGWRCTRCWVGPDVGSPHRPLIADMEWADTPQ
jgi:vancomycin resistance protein VanJ